MRLVKGSTDLLQPINLLPNSDFSRRGGYPETQTYSNLSRSQQVTIGEGILFQAYNGILSSLTIVFSDNSIRISGNFSEPTPDNGHLRLLIKLTSIPGKLYTERGTFTVNSINALTGSFGTVGFTNSSFSGNHYYNKDTRAEEAVGKNVESVRIRSFNDSTYWLCPKLGFNSGTSGSFDFTISNLCVYEGAYTNPPIYKSLDVQPSNQFHLASREYPNGYIQYQSAPLAMYNKAQWGASNAVLLFEHKIHAHFSNGAGTKKLVFHKTNYGVGNNDNSILIGRFAIAYTTTNSSQRAYGYAYDFYYQIYGVQDTIAAFNGKLTELYKASGLSVTPSIGYSLESGTTYILYLEFPDNLTTWGGRLFMEYNISSDYGRVGTHTDYSFRQPYYI